MTGTATALALRPMRWWHLEPVLAIERQVFPQPWTAEQFWSELAGVPSRRHYVVAEHDEAVVGYAGVALGDDTADVMTIAVAGHARRSGIGRALLLDLVGVAARRRIREVLLEVRADNDAALALYESLGFTRLSRRRGYYGPGQDGVIMRRRGTMAVS